MPAKAGDPYLEAVVFGAAGITKAVGKAAVVRAWSGVAGLFGREAAEDAVGLWSRGIYQRGKAIEDLLGKKLDLGTNLNKLWRTDFVRGVDFVGRRGGSQLFSQVTSVNLSSASNASGAAILKTLAKKTDSLAAVVDSGAVRYGANAIRVLPDAQKQLVVAISSYKPSFSQIAGLAQAARYGQSAGVSVVIRVVR